ncbi:alkaline phosphatase D family protein [Verminephrobacter eiseniae]|uniref:alkaline phosphatase D family protein n=1 Tax=Verminephrobacter eiseniae TaxID=364317 RepID=UPI0038B324F9
MRPCPRYSAAPSCCTQHGRQAPAARPAGPGAGRRRPAATPSRWEHGHCAAWRHLAADQPDLVLFLGDYIYESASPRERTGLVSRHRSLVGLRAACDI